MNDATGVNTVATTEVDTATAATGGESAASSAFNSKAEYLTYLRLRKSMGRNVPVGIAS